jgi:hypothetical protein
MRTISTAHYILGNSHRRNLTNGFRTDFQKLKTNLLDSPIFLYFKVRVRANNGRFCNFLGILKVPKQIHRLLEYLYYSARMSCSNAERL